MMQDSLDHLHTVVYAARERWPGQPLTVTIGRRESLAIREEVVRFGQVKMADRTLIQITHFMDYPVTVRPEVEHGVWVEPRP